MKRGNEWEVVDGQQRLTTIFLILKRMSLTETPPIHIRYERHPNTEQGLAELLQSPSKECSPDFYFIQKADGAIQQWLKEHPTKLASLTNCDGNGPCAKFIWYEINRDSHGGHGEAIRAYTRLNAGKIRLKDSELIRASLLQSGVLHEGDRQRIAIEWDRVERRLQNPEFWSFLNKNGDAPDSRIELLFCLLAKNKDKGLNETGDRKIFHEYFNLLEKAGDPAAERKTLWEEIDACFGFFDEWFEDHCLFHLIGFLIDLEPEQKHRNLILEFLNDSGQFRKPESPNGSKSLRKTELIIKLKRMIRERVLPEVNSAERVRDNFAKLNYGLADKDKIRKVLLCLNLATLLADKTKTVRFSFDAYKRYEWDIEHIRATADHEPETVDELRDALTMLCNFLEDLKAGGDELLSAQVELKKKSTDRNRLSDLYKKLCEILHRMIGENAEISEPLEASDGIKNLTLLDCGTNRGYGNSGFAVKRSWILGIDWTKYLLPCTRNVFTKSYSKAPGSLLHWTQMDADDYLEAIAGVLTEFFKDTWETKP
jgi:hypothetical protein